jgi:TRAP-type C4-dicarboxylate transport system permease small subunit
MLLKKAQSKEEYNSIAEEIYRLHNIESILSVIYYSTPLFGCLDFLRIIFSLYHVLTISTNILNHQNQPESMH